MINVVIPMAGAGSRFQLSGFWTGSSCPMRIIR